VGQVHLRERPPTRGRRKRGTLIRGSIYKRGPTWTAVYDETREDGKRRQRSKGGFATRREAQAFLTATLSRLDDGSYAQPSKVTLGEYLTREWLPAVKSTLRPLSHTQYASVIKLRIVPSSAMCGCKRSLVAI
jgi:hypothetical protein